ncbi:hypothetical protein VB711_24845 [Cronbergia sp. UHCC 0137]|uniref:hypothetical protein n=1 Tax=Cronbergia sp. UHCC 0137 TaxID=3110239 RepID=UPI002B20F5B3|nr:hypothetical protein [Cronbergia sp. UHCC 0137]MEA5621038.1 hypothetical protein [Cronbergia sp. UHCC 0137]
MEVKQNDDKLVVDYNRFAQYFTSSLPITTFFILPLLFGLGEFIPRYRTINCQRIEPKQVNCRIQEKIIIPISETAPIQINAAEVIQIEKIRENLEFHEYQVELYSSSGIQRFGYPKNSQNEIKEIVSKINSFLKNPIETNFKLTQVDKSSIDILSTLIFLSLFYLIWYGSLFLVVISIILKFPLKEKWDFDRKSYKLVVMKKFLFWDKKNEYSLLGKLNLKIDSEKSSDTTIYNLDLILESTDKLTIYSAFSLNKVEEMAENIGDFLDLLPSR